jgi:predicted metalloprotease with PDZ domain
MIQYTFSYSKPHRHFIDIEMLVEKHDASELILQLPAWRPGRYEISNFAKNIRGFKIFNEANELVPFQKSSKDFKMETQNKF